MNLHQLSLTPFRTPFYLRNPHVQSILPKFIHTPMPNYQRVLCSDSTGTTQVAYDFVYADKSNAAKLPIAVMFHGLEGSSGSHYAMAFANFAVRHGWNAVIVHFRGCGGMDNTAEPDYHAGDTAEAHHVLSLLKTQFPHVVATGFSLGGNVLARYMGEYGDNAVCDGAVVVSAPVDLASSAKSLHKFIAKRVYTPYLLKSLLEKALLKVEDNDLATAIKNIKTLDKFDDLYTAPRHGYGTGENYYKVASALPVLKNITKPTLIITAKDDPFLGKVATQQDISERVRLLYSEHGGHVGFIRRKKKKLDITWLPKVTFELFDWAVKKPETIS